MLALYKAQQMIDLWNQLAVGAEDFPSVFQADLRAIEQTVCFGEGLDNLLREIVAF